MATIWKPWSAKIVRAGDRLAEVAGAEEGDVVLARGAQDLADLADQRVDVVADAALAELAEAGEVAADLGRVDVRVLGELLRGDRLAAHLAGLGQHLQVAREARGDAEREPLAFDRQRQAPRSGSTVPCSIMPPQYRASPAAAARSSTSSETTSPVDLDDRDPLEVARAAALRRSRCRSRAARTGSPPRAARRSPRDRLLAEVAARAASRE